MTKAAEYHRLYEEGMTPSEIRVRLGVSRQRVSAVLKGAPRRDAGRPVLPQTLERIALLRSLIPNQVYTLPMTRNQLKHARKLITDMRFRELQVLPDNQIIVVRIY